MYARVCVCVNTYIYTHTSHGLSKDAHGSGTDAAFVGWRSAVSDVEEAMGLSKWAYHAQLR